MLVPRVEDLSMPGSGGFPGYRQHVPAMGCLGCSEEGKAVGRHETPGFAFQLVDFFGAFIRGEIGVICLLGVWFAANPRPLGFCHGCERTNHMEQILTTQKPSPPAVKSGFTVQVDSIFHESIGKFNDQLTVITEPTLKT